MYWRMSVRVGVGLQAVRRVAAQQPDRVQRAGAGPEDEVERAREAEVVHRDRHPGRHGAAHPAALDRERDTGARGAVAQRLDDRVRHAASDASAVRRPPGISTGRREARSTNTCTNQPVAAASSAPCSRSSIS